MNSKQLSDVLHTEALNLVKQGEAEKATQKLSEAVRQAPDDPRLHADLLRVLILNQRFSDATQLASNLPAELQSDPQLSHLCAHVELLSASKSQDREMPKLIMNYYMSLEKSPDQLDKRLELASILLKIDDIESSLEQLYLIRQQDRTYHNDIGHRGLLALFTMLGDDNELVEKYRLKLS